MDSLALYLRRPAPLHPRSGPSNFLYALLSPSSRLRCSSVVTPPTPSYHGLSAVCVSDTEVPDYRLSPVRCSGLTPRQGESRGGGGSTSSSSFAKDIFPSSSTATIKLFRYVSHQFQRVAHLKPPWRSSPDPAVIISHPSVIWTSTHGGCHHLRGSANCQRLFRARSYIQATFLHTCSSHGGSCHGGSIFPSLNHGGLNGDRTCRGTGPFISLRVKCFSEEAHGVLFFLDCILR